ncbi:MAG: CotH kinase family protein [Acutalibacteraceae bacterium]|jgi:hypothetical protein
MKRFWSILLVFCLLCAPLSGVAAEPGVAYMPGDVNGDGEVSAEDALMALQAATGKIALSPEQETAGDINGDGEVSAEDALMILQFATAKIDAFPVPNEPQPAEKTPLLAAIGAATLADTANRTDESLQALQTALDEAKAVALDPDATQQQVDDAAAALIAAIEGLTDKPPAPPVDKAALEAAIEAAREPLNAPDPYTQESVDALTAAMNAATQVAADVDATQEQVDQATAALTAAIEGLAEKPPAPPVDKTALEAAIEAAQEPVNAPDLYTQASFDALAAALVAAVQVDEDAAATQENVDAATAALTAAIDGLVEIPVEPQPGKEDIYIYLPNANGEAGADVEITSGEGHYLGGVGSVRGFADEPGVLAKSPVDLSAYADYDLSVVYDIRINRTANDCPEFAGMSDEEWIRYIVNGSAILYGTAPESAHKWSIGEKDATYKMSCGANGNLLQNAKVGEYVSVEVPVPEFILSEGVISGWDIFMYNDLHNAPGRPADMTQGNRGATISVRGVAIKAVYQGYTDPVTGVEILPLGMKKVEAESGRYPDSCQLVNHSRGTSVGYTSKDNEYTYTVSLSKSGYYLIPYTMSVTVEDIHVTLTVDGQPAYDQVAYFTNDWGVYATNCPSEPVYLTAGDHTLVFKQSKNGLNFDWFGLIWLAENGPDDLPAQRIITAAFTDDKAQTGVPLPLTITGLQTAGELQSYVWLAGGTLSKTASVYAPSGLQLVMMGDVHVWPTLLIDGKTYYIHTSGSFTAMTDPLPTVTINTAEGAPITSKEEYLAATMTIAADGVDAGQLYDGDIEIRGRGNATWGYPKKPYKVKLAKKADLFGMGSNKHWVLLANYRDRSFQRTHLAFAVSEQLGLPTPQSIWVNVILNGRYVGVYELCEQIRVGKTRVNIHDWTDDVEDETDLSSITAENGFDTTGGFILEINGYYDEVSKFTTDHGVKITVKEPEYLYTGDELFQYAIDYVQDFEDAVYAENFTNAKGQHYSELFDVDSLVNYWLTCEFMANLDSGSWSSTYMYKDIGGDKMHMGPVWDFDSSAGNYLDHSLQAPADKWVATHQGKWYKELYRDRTFVEKLYNRYWENHDFFVGLAAQAEEWYVDLYNDAKADHELWNIPTTYEYDGELVIKWLRDRVAFFDEQFATLDTAYQSLLNNR